MRILFGPEHDGLHVNPSVPGAYEWWYFDALSYDGRYALVAIFFLGSPMSPYYKAVVDGKKPNPQDWCGVFVSLHENLSPVPVMGPIDRKINGGRWRERAYAYNLYRGGEFAENGNRVAVGRSEFVAGPPSPPPPATRVPGPSPNSERGGSEERGSSPVSFSLLPALGEGPGVRADLSYHLSLHEPGLWFSRIDAELAFTPVGSPVTHQPIGNPDDLHTWVCAAPTCRVAGVINGIHFSGKGYHDHNFGTLPYQDIDLWYWNRSEVRRFEKGETLWETVLSYHFEKAGRPTQIFLMTSDAGQWRIFDPKNIVVERRLSEWFGTEPNPQVRSRYGLEHEVATGYHTNRGESVSYLPHLEGGILSEGPFYRRYFTLNAGELALTTREARETPNQAPTPVVGTGIGEVFRPAGLLDPMVNLMMWTRMRRR